VGIFISFASRPYYDQIYNCNLEISPIPAIIKRIGQNWLMHSKVTGLSKTLKDTFVLSISSMSLSAQQKQFCCQIKAEILKFMWVCGKCRFGQKIPLWLQNEKIVRFSPFSTNYFPLEIFGKRSYRATHFLLLFHDLRVDFCFPEELFLSPN
jgi:hypothetical protein